MGFRVVHFQERTAKLPAGKSLRFALLADLHGRFYGEGVLSGAVLREKVDLVLAAGDLILRTKAASLDIARATLEELSAHLPVYLGMGNHESILARDSALGCPEGPGSAAAFYEEYEEAIRKAGVKVLRNETAAVSVKGIPVSITGLELPLECYHKPFPASFSLEDMERLSGKGGEGLRVLIAHDPLFMDTYLSWGADLIVSGHYHGGILRLGRNLIAASPYFRPFPRYGVGDFHRKGTHIYVSPGLGEHSIPIRIHNPRELYIITLTGEDDGNPGKASDL